MKQNDQGDHLNLYIAPPISDHFLVPGNSYIFYVSLASVS